MVLVFLFYGKINMPHDRKQLRRRNKWEQCVALSIISHLHLCLSCLMAVCLDWMGVLQRGAVVMLEFKAKLDMDGCFESQTVEVSQDSQCILKCK